MNILILGKVFTCRLYDKDQVVVCMMSLLFCLKSQINDDTSWMDGINRWAISSLSCLAGNTLAVAVIIRLICSPGLTLFSLCLLVVHEHFDI